MAEELRLLCDIIPRHAAVVVLDSATAIRFALRMTVALTISRRMDLESFLAPTASAFLAHRQIRGDSTASHLLVIFRPPNVGP